MPVEGFFGVFLEFFLAFFWRFFGDFLAIFLEKFFWNRVAIGLSEGQGKCGNRVKSGLR